MRKIAGISPEMDEMIRKLQKRMQEKGMNISYAEASRILAKEFNPDAIEPKLKKKRGKIEFDFGF